MARLRREDRSPPKYGRDLQELEQLIAKHSLKTVLKCLIDEHGLESLRAALATAIKVDTKAPAGKRGRPTTVIEDMHLADWIYTVANDDYCRGRKPVEQAMLDLYDLTLDGSEQKHHPFTIWERRIKEKRLRGLNAWRLLAHQIRKQPDLAKAIGQTLPDWLERYK
jgi:hypothetical protein